MRRASYPPEVASGRAFTVAEDRDGALHRQRPLENRVTSLVWTSRG
jgi:hypothetical protein